MAPNPDLLLELFADAFAAQRRALASMTGSELRARTDRPGQYALDVVVDDAVLGVLRRAGVAVVSEESGRTGPPDAEVTVVVDPVDGSTNCARGIPYWAISLCALDGDGPLCSLVGNGATGECTTAVRGGGAWLDGTRLTSAPTARARDGLIVINGLPPRARVWKQYRALGAAALILCDVAAGRVDGYLDTVPDGHAPWDYLGGLLACTEAGAVVVDVAGRPLAVADPDARRQLVAGVTPAVLDDLVAALGEA
ncbi:MAG TPA: inositol monophosphatase [Acidimicrobiia bacterium]|nr:inositol monophosphatase [Acidimicrobiia bacterium]